MDSIPMSNWIFYLLFTFLCFCTCAESTCTPEAVKDALDQCLMNNHMGTYYMFPIVSASNYRNLCFNTTCLTYCMELVASPCTSHDHMVHLGNGEALTAAYLGLCDQTEDEVTSALTCGSSISNQDALNAISTFQTSLESSYSTSSENTTVICSEWSTMKTTLDSLVSGQCSGTSLTHWQTLLNTVSYNCDNSLSPSWYTDYRQTPNNRCSGSECLLPSIPILVFHLIILYITNNGYIN